jgi:hypothetical protein
VIRFAFALGAVVFELAALAFLFGAPRSTPGLTGFLLAHLAASLCLALSTWRTLPAHYREPRLWVQALIFSFCFFIPFIGPLGLLVALVVAALLPKTIVQQPFARVETPELVLSIQDPELSFGEGGIKSLLMNPTTPVPLRLKSLLALQNMPVRIVGPMLRQLLSDPEDDIRLTAYGMLDAQEKKILDRIRSERERVGKAEDPAVRFTSLRHLAELYWELVYAGLVQGDLRTHALDTAVEYVRQAEAMSPGEPGIRFLHGRLELACGRLAAAEEGFRAAVARGIPETRVLPYLAEIAYGRGDYLHTRALMARIAGEQVTPLMAPLMRYWTGLNVVGREPTSGVPL